MGRYPSDSAQDDPTLNGILDTMRRLDDDYAGIITGYVVVAEWIDTAGEKRIYTATLEDQRCHATLGLLDFALTVERARAADSWREDD